MAKYLNPQTGMVEEIGNPELNPTLIAGKTLVPDDTPFTGDTAGTGAYATPSSTITSASLAPTTPPQLTPVVSSPIPSTAGLFDEPSETEKQFEAERTRIKELGAEIAGEGAFKAEQRGALGVTADQSLLDEQNRELRRIQAQQRELRGEFEKQMAGRASQGTIEGMIEKRNRELTVDALRTSALMDYTQGRLTAAERKINDAVEAKFGRAKAEKEALIEDLNFILKSPKSDREDKKRAAAQIAIQQAEKAKIEKQEQDLKDVEEAVKMGVQNGLRDGTIISKIRKAQTGAEALQILAESGYGAKAGGGDIAEFKSFFPDVDITTPQGRQQYLRWSSQVAATKKEPKDATGVAPSRAADQLTFLRDTAASALTLAGASGRSGARRTFESWFVGSTNYTKLEALTNTLRTNVLTLMTDPDIKKFFGPQMSEADVRLMTAAGTTLNPELQGPKQMTAEIKRLDNLLNRMQTAVSSGLQGGANIITAPDGTQIELID